MTGLLLASLSVGLSNFAAAIGIGLSGVDGRTRLRVGLAFGVFESIMPVIGILLGHSLSGTVGHTGRYAGGALLVATGAYSIIQGRRRPRGEASPAGVETGDRPALGLKTSRLLVTAFALSIDNLVVGFALGVYPVPPLLAGAVIAGVSVTLSLVGLELGSRLGRNVEQWAEEIGGAVLMLVGVALGFGVLS
jgi:manganese efflux pump family protein